MTAPAFLVKSVQILLALALLQSTPNRFFAVASSSTVIASGSYVIQADNEQSVDTNSASVLRKRSLKDVWVPVDTQFDDDFLDKATPVSTNTAEVSNNSNPQNTNANTTDGDVATEENNNLTSSADPSTYGNEFEHQKGGHLDAVLAVFVVSAFWFGVLLYVAQQLIDNPTGMCSLICTQVVDVCCCCWREDQDSHHHHHQSPVKKKDEGTMWAERNLFNIAIS